MPGVAHQISVGGKGHIISLCVFDYNTQSIKSYRPRVCADQSWSRFQMEWIIMVRCFVSLDMHVSCRVEIGTGFSQISAGADGTVWAVNAKHESQLLCSFASYLLLQSGATRNDERDGMLIPLNTTVLSVLFAPSKLMFSQM